MKLSTVLSCLHACLFGDIVISPHITAIIVETGKSWQCNASAVLGNPTPPQVNFVSTMIPCIFQTGYSTPPHTGKSRCPLSPSLSLVRYITLENECLLCESCGYFDQYLFRLNFSTNKALVCIQSLGGGRGGVCAGLGSLDGWLSMVLPWLSWIHKNLSQNKDGPYTVLTVYITVKSTIDYILKWKHLAPT